MSEFVKLDLGKLLYFDLSKELENFANAPLWSVYAFIDAMVMIRHADLVCDDNLSDDIDVETLINETFEEYFEKFKSAGSGQPQFVDCPEIKRESSYLPWQVGLIYNLKTFLSSVIDNTRKKVNKDSQLLAKCIRPLDAIEFARCQGWPLHPALMKVSATAETASPITAEEASELKRGQAGAKERWAKRDILVEHAEKFMNTLLKMECKCNHEKLASITYELATNDDGVVLKDCDPKGFGLKGAIKRKAKSLVPEERQFGNEKYNSEACGCQIADHQKFKMSRHR